MKYEIIIFLLIASKYLKLLSTKQNEKKMQTAIFDKTNIKFSPNLFKHNQNLSKQYSEALQCHF